MPTLLKRVRKLKTGFEFLKVLVTQPSFRAFRELIHVVILLLQNPDREHVGYSGVPSQQGWRQQRQNGAGTASADPNWNVALLVVVNNERGLLFR
jgi:hypothetical protein